MPKVAVIDSGTNTFALNIYESETPPTPFKRVYKERYFVELAEDGIQEIGAKPYQRALEAYRRFRQTLDQQKIAVESVRATGTAALRSAHNGAELVAQIQRETGIRIEIIDGEREAQLIYQGVRLASPLNDQHPAMIMDIGGGSVEFILCNRSEIFWKKSFPLGVAVLFAYQRPSNPALPEELERLRVYLTDELEELWAKARQIQPRLLVGASGTFDVLVAMTGRRRGQNPYDLLSLQEFEVIFQKLINSTYEERLQMADLPPTRAKLVIGALVLIDMALRRIPIGQIAISDYALREGLAWEMFCAQI